MKTERAKIFAAFSPLNGFYEEIRKKERVTVPKAEVSDDLAQEINDTLKGLKITDVVTVVYYCKDEYLKVTGCVSRIDTEKRVLTVVLTEIKFDDIYSIKSK